MKISSYKTVRFDLDEEEKAIMNDAWEIMKKVREKFITNGMETHQEQMHDLMKLLSDVVQGKEIKE